MKFLETATNGNVYAGTFGGMLLSVFSNVFVEDLVRTVILAFVGAVVSFLVSLVLKNFIRRKNR
jgi:ABC-type phosphate/phosphonate transport system permease subunit